MQHPIDSRQLVAFVTLARTGSYTRTARELFLTHSAISHSMRALEEEVGCLLLHRVDKKVALTEAGEAFLHHARRALQESQNARAAIMSLNKWGFQKLRLGVAPHMARTFLPRVLETLRQEHPHLLLEMVHWGSENPASFLENNQINLLLGEKIQRPADLEFTTLFENRYVLVVPPTHAWNQPGASHRLSLPTEPCLIGRRDSPGRQLIEAYFAAENLTLNVVAELESTDVLLDLVRLGLGFGVVPQWRVQAELDAGSLVGFPPGKRELRQSWGLFRRPDKRLHPIESRFVELLLAHHPAALHPRRKLARALPRQLT